MATQGKSDGQIWSEMAAKWDVAHKLAVMAQFRVANEMNANYQGSGPAPSIEAMDKTAALWAEANGLRDEMEEFIRSRFG